MSSVIYCHDHFLTIINEIGWLVHLQCNVPSGIARKQFHWHDEDSLSICFCSCQSSSPPRTRPAERKRNVGRGQRWGKSGQHETALDLDIDVFETVGDAQVGRCANDRQRPKSLLVSCPRTTRRAWAPQRSMHRWPAPEDARHRCKPGYLRSPECAAPRACPAQARGNPQAAEPWQTAQQTLLGHSSKPPSRHPLRRGKRIVATDLLRSGHISIAR